MNNIASNYIDYLQCMLEIIIKKIERDISYVIPIALLLAVIDKLIKSSINNLGLGIMPSMKTWDHIKLLDKPIPRDSS